MANGKNSSTDAKQEMIRNAVFCLVAAIVASWLIPAFYSFSFLFATTAVAGFGIVIGYTGWQAYMNGKAYFTHDPSFQQAAQNSNGVFENQAFLNSAQSAATALFEKLKEFAKIFLGDWEQNRNHPLNNNDDNPFAQQPGEFTTNTAGVTEVRRTSTPTAESHTSPSLSSSNQPDADLVADNSARI